VFKPGALPGDDLFTQRDNRLAGGTKKQNILPSSCSNSECDHPFIEIRPSEIYAHRRSGRVWSNFLIRECCLVELPHKAPPEFMEQ